MISNVSSSQGMQDLAAMREKMFKKADKSGDGKITKEELTAVMPQRDNSPSVDDIFSKIDTNQDGGIDQAEDTAAFEQMQKNRPAGGPPPRPDMSQMATKLFSKADQDGDGKINKTELSSILPQDTEDSKIEDIFKQSDSDEDGSISQSELETTLKKMMEEMHSKQAGQAGPPGYDRAGGATAEIPAGSFSAIA